MADGGWKVAIFMKDLGLAVLQFENFPYLFLGDLRCITTQNMLHSTRNPPADKFPPTYRTKRCPLKGDGFWVWLLKDLMKIR